MRDLPLVADVPALTAAEMAAVDHAAALEYGMALDALMENAARGVAAAARAFLDGTVAGTRIIALAGPGNNGGDALAAARHLANWGAEIALLLAAPAGTLRPLPKRQYDALRAAGLAREASDLHDFDLVLDGLLGFSARGVPRGAVAELIARANRSVAPILAIDLPSGLDPDSGTVEVDAIRAAVTVTLGLPKRGLLAAQARPYVGTLLLADIGVPLSVYDRFGVDARHLFRDGELVRVG